MIKSGLILIYLALTVQSVICQNAYPRRAIIDKDTVCILSIQQIREVNKSLIDLDECIELKDSLNSQINNYDSLVSKKNAIILHQDKQILINREIILHKDEIIDIGNKEIQKQNIKIKSLKTQRTIFASIPAIAAIIITCIKVIK